MKTRIQKGVGRGATNSDHNGKEVKEPVRRPDNKDPRPLSGEAVRAGGLFRALGAMGGQTPQACAE